jgi:nucleotide-binding universal stress UspA family protein
MSERGSDVRIERTKGGTMYSTLLWATDGSPESDLALTQARELLSPGGRLVAFHCDQRFMVGRSAGAPIVADELDRRRRVVDQVDDLRTAGVNVELYLETTNRSAPHEIAVVADEVGADANVCGTRGLGGLTGLLNGSVAAGLLRYATVPVIVVPAKSAEREAVTS